MFIRCRSLLLTVLFIIRRTGALTSIYTDNDLSAESNLRPQFTKLLLDHLDEALNCALHDSREIVNRVLMDSTIVAVDTAAMQLRRTKLAEFVEDVERTQAKQLPIDYTQLDYFLLLDQKCDMLRKFEKIMERFCADRLKVSGTMASSEDLLIEVALKRHGLDKYKSDMHERKENFLENFAKSWRSRG